MTIRSSLSNVGSKGIHLGFFFKFWFEKRSQHFALNLQLSFVGKFLTRVSSNKVFDRIGQVKGRFFVKVEMLRTTQRFTPLLGQTLCFLHICAWKAQKEQFPLHLLCAYGKSGGVLFTTVFICQQLWQQMSYKRMILKITCSKKQVPCFSFLQTYP